MKPEHRVSLTSFNTLAVPAVARYFVAVTSVEELREAIRFSGAENLPRLIVGGGSNIVLSGDFPGLVIHLQLAGIELLEEGDEHVTIRVAAGENWDALVQYSLAQNWYGLENLSAIPGSVGAAPIQNIGAYGVELSDVLTAVSGLEVDTLVERTLSKAECALSYRDSVFKGPLKDRFIITSVELRLSKVPRPNLSYPALAEALGSAVASPLAVAEAVRRVRASKLPSPSTLPNVGSFFKNPIVSKACYKELRERHPDLPAWDVAEGVKLAAGWLVEQAGWKGYRGQGDLDGLGVHSEQALVVINPGGKPGAAVLSLANKIQESVRERFGVVLALEPRVY